MKSLKSKLILLLFLNTVYFTFARSQDSVAIVNGLALYRVGDGNPVVLMPYPHASGYSSMSESPLTKILNDLGFSVLTFDPPGIFKSTRKTDVTLKEMLDCTNELINYFNIDDGFLIIGHSQSAFCALAYAIEYPKKVDKMILVGAASGWPVVKKSSIHKQFGFFEKERWQMMYWGTRKMLNMSNLKIHKKLDNLVHYTCLVNKNLWKPIPINKSDRKEPEPIRAKWMMNLRKYNYDYANRLNEVDVPTLICVGQQDPLTPVSMSNELNNGIGKSTLITFEKSGHSPFVEERNNFEKSLRDWLE